MFVDKVDNLWVILFCLREATTSNMLSNDGSVRVNLKKNISLQIIKANILILTALFSGESSPSSFSRLATGCSMITQMYFLDRFDDKKQERKAQE